MAIRCAQCGAMVVTVWLDGGGMVVVALLRSEHGVRLPGIMRCVCEDAHFSNRPRFSSDASLDAHLAEW
ncbi:hypothetical protein ACSI09_002324 [Escherichia coli]